MTQASLQRLIITFKPDEFVMHALYRTQDGPGPNTKARRREVSGLVRTGLQDALEALEVPVEVVGTSGFTMRGDVLCLSQSYEPREAGLVRPCPRLARGLGSARSWTSPKRCTPMNRRSFGVCTTRRRPPRLCSRL